MTADLAQRTRSPFESIKQTDEHGEFWSARDLQPLLGYVEWRKFEDSIERAVFAVRNSGLDPADHIGDAAKMVQLGSGSSRFIQDYRLTKYGSYVVAMNGDPRKTEVAEAQTYFAVRTHQAEVADAVTRALPQTFSEALRLAADEYEARVVAERQVAELAPRAAVADKILDASGTYDVADAAKSLTNAGIQIGRQRLFTHTESLGWIYRGRDDREYRIYQTAIETGRLFPRPRSHYRPDTGELVLDVPQVRVTPKGLAYLLRDLTGERHLEVVA